MNRSLLVLTITFAVSLFCKNADASCTPPAKPGALLCYPSNNVTLTYPIQFEGAATGDGLPIVAMVLYADNVKEYEIQNYDTFTWLYSSTGTNDPLQFNGTHHLVLNAWDSEGHVYQTSSYVHQINGRVPQCAAPSAGFNLCSPTNNAYYPDNDIPVEATGAANLTSYATYMNGLPAGTEGGPNLNMMMGVEESPKSFNLVIKGYDSAGKIYTSGITFRVFYPTYGSECGRLGCTAGIEYSSPVASPQTNADVASPFTVTASVQGYPNPITAMRIYLDNTSVTTTYGPSVSYPVPAAPGSHLVTIQAWDSAGALYRSQFNVNVQ